MSDIEGIAREAIILKSGKIVDVAPPKALAQKLCGSVWDVSCTSEEAERLKKEFRISATLPSEDGVRLRLLSSKAPGRNAVTVEPTLEDYYLSVFGGVT